MKRWLGWTLVLGLGGALATGCSPRSTEDAQQVGKPSTPIQQKNRPPSAPAAEPGVGGSGSQGLQTPQQWKVHSDVSRSDTGAGTYLPNQPQPVPRERRPAPLGVGGGPDNARRLAIEQLKH